MTLFETLTAEMPLVLFTTLSQGVVGLVVLYALSLIWVKDTNIKSFGLVGAIAMAIAIIPSIFHLGDISHALYFAKRLFGFSLNGSWHIGWMNAEVAMAGLTFITLVILWLKGNKIWLYLSALFGLLCIFFMAGAYGSMQNSVNTWRFDITLLYFYSSVLFLGAVFYHFGYANSNKKMQYGFLLGLIGIGILTNSLILQTIHLGVTDVVGVGKAFDLLDGTYDIIIMIGTMLLGISIVLWYLNFYSGSKNKILSLLVLISAVGGVMVTRLIFYGLINTHIMHG